MTITITIGDLPVEVQVTYYTPPIQPPGVYGPGSAAEVEWEGPGWLLAMADHFNLWAQIDKLVIDAIADRRKQGGGA